MTPCLTCWVCVCVRVRGGVVIGSVEMGLAMQGTKVVSVEKGLRVLK